MVNFQIGRWELGHGACVIEKKTHTTQPTPPPPPPNISPHSKNIPYYDMFSPPPKLYNNTIVTINGHKRKNDQANIVSFHFIFSTFSLSLTPFPPSFSSSHPFSQTLYASSLYQIHSPSPFLIFQYFPHFLHHKLLPHSYF